MEERMPSPNPYPQDSVGESALMNEPSPCESNKIRPIEIEELNRGYIVRVGCHRFAISTKGELIAKLAEYISEPNVTEKKWFKQELF